MEGMITVALQAGGGSRRMGRDKALVRLAGRPLIQHVLDRVASLGDEILVTTNHPQAYAFLDVRLVVDAVPGQGALGGLRTALAAARGETVLVLASDMPFVSHLVLGRLLALATEADVIVPRWKGEYEPLLAVYSKACLPAVEKALEAGKRRMISFYPEVRVRVVEESEISGIDPLGLSFFNINTPEDLAQAEERLRELSGQ
jgi:molybdopterin-guanine dinucleotide biosynthesis protein A